MKHDLKKTRVLIAEDEALVRHGIVALLETEVNEVMQACNGEQAIEMLKSEKFDIALIDIGLPKRTGLDVMADVRLRNNPVKIIILTGDTNTYSPAKILRNGADAFMYKTVDAENFLDTFISVAKGEKFSTNVNNKGENATAIAQIRDNLTPRELQIVKIIAEGASNKEAAETLFISEHTVRKHREHINRKLGIKSPTALASFAIKAGLV